jgi:hypothetical protein
MRLSGTPGARLVQDGQHSTGDRPGTTEGAPAMTITLSNPTASTSATATSATAAANTAPTYDFDLVVVDLYRDIHKGIRAELFDITATAGNLDPADRYARADLAGHVLTVGHVLEMHAEHEDLAIEPVLAEWAPTLAEQIHNDHVVLDVRFAAVTELAQASVEAVTVDQRRLTHLLYLELAGFTSAYLAHQIVEERVVMPTLEQAIGPAAVGAIHGAIVGSIPPEEMARSLAFMLPAMNLDDRVELLSGVRMGAPAEVFGGVVGLARSVLHPVDFASLANRLDVA